VLDATRAVHGDLGMIHPNDVVLALSHSGESEEVVRLLPSLRQLAQAVIGLTSNGRSTLARQADVALVLGPLTEVCPLGLAPSTSTTAMIAVGDALAFVLTRMREFTHEDFARFHRPAASAASCSRSRRSCGKARNCGWRTSTSWCAPSSRRPGGAAAAPGRSC